MGAQSTARERCDIPPALREALEKAAPAQYDDCLRVLAETTEKLPPAQAHYVRLVALRKLIQRCERGAVSNPAGLLRACIVSEAVNGLEDLTESCTRLRMDILRNDAALKSASTGFSAIRCMRKRAIEMLTYRAHHESVFGVEPTDIPAPAADDPALSAALLEVERLLDLLHAAREGGDPTKVARIQEALRRVENQLNELTRRTVSGAS